MLFINMYSYFTRWLCSVTICEEEAGPAEEGHPDVQGQGQVGPGSAVVQKVS